MVPFVRSRPKSTILFKNACKWERFEMRKQENMSVVRRGAGERVLSPF